MKLREALIQQAPSIELQRAAANEIARLDAALIAERERIVASLLEQADKAHASRNYEQRDELQAAAYFVRKA